MKDKDTKLIWEAYGTYDEDRAEHEVEIPGHDDDDPVYDEVRELEQKDKLNNLKDGSAELEDMEVGKDIIGFTIQFQDNKWWKLINQEEVEDENADPQWVVVTGTERSDIWAIDDPESHAQHRAEGQGMRRQLRQSGL